MRLIGFAFRDVRKGPLRAGYTALGDVTALIGPNDSGKSSTLGLLAHAMAPDSAAELRTFAGRADETETIVYVACSPGERDLLLGQVADPTHDPAETPDLDSDDAFEVMRGPSADPRGSIVQLEIDLADRYGAATAELICSALDATRIFAFQLNTDRHDRSSWTVHWCLRADHSLASAAAGEALELARVAASGEPIALWTLGSTQLGVLPRPVLAPQGLVAALNVIEGVIWVLATCIRMTDDSDELYDDAFAAGYDDHDSWVVGTDGGRELRVHSLILALVEAAEAAANQALPAFVRERYRLSIEVRPILLWAEAGRLRLSLVAEDMTQFDAERAAAGLLTWIEIAVLEAAAMLEGHAGVAEFIATGDHDWDYQGEDSTFATPAEVETVARILHASAVIEDPLVLLKARHEPRRFAEWVFGDLRRHRASTIELFAGRLLGRPYYLIDEPERHLHVGLQRTAARWLHDTFSQEDAQALIATHAPAFLNAGPNVDVVRVDRGNPRQGLLAIDPDALRATDELSRAMGFDRGELLAGLAAIVYVEGSFDRLVIEGLLRDELRQAAIAVRAFGGTHNITEILKDPLLSYTVARVAVIVDNVGEKELRKLTSNAEHRKRRADGDSGEPTFLARLLEGAERHGRHIEPFSIGERDMFFLLDDLALQSIDSRWPGHDQAWKAWGQERATDHYGGWKEFFAGRFGVRVNNATARRAADHMRDRGVVPPVLSTIMDSLERMAFEIG